MEQAVSLIVFSMIFTSLRVASAPTPSDSISGRDFLTILMKSTNYATQSMSSSATIQHHHHHQQQPNNSQVLRKLRHFFYEKQEHGDSVLPIEELFSSHDDMSLSRTLFYGNSKNQHQQSIVHDQLPPLNIIDSTRNATFTSLPLPKTLHSNKDYGSDGVTLPTVELSPTKLSTTSFGRLAKLNTSNNDESFSSTPVAENTGGLEPRNITSVTFTELSIDEQTLTTEFMTYLFQSNVRDAKSSEMNKTIDKQGPAIWPTRSSKSHRLSKVSVEQFDQAISKEQNYAIRTESVAIPKSISVSQKPILSDNGHYNNYRGLQLAPSNSSHQRHRIEQTQDSKGIFQSLHYQANHGHQEKRERLKTPSPLSTYLGEISSITKRWRDIGNDTSSNTRIDATNRMVPPPEAEILTSMIREVYSKTSQIYAEPAQYYSESAKVYSEPSKKYNEPKKVYSLPARVYSEPAKVYSVPATVYSEPAKVYSEPAKIYSHPSSYWKTFNSIAGSTTTKTVATAYMNSSSYVSSSGILLTTTLPPQSQRSISVRLGQHQRQRLVFNELDKIPYDQLNAPTFDNDSRSIHKVIGKFVPKQYQTMNNGGEQVARKLPEIINRTGEDSRTDTTNQEQTPAVVQTLTLDSGSGDNSKVGYVVEGRNYRKYRVEEKTPDGFIVGEYGVLSHNDGNLRGVRYTAESDINPCLIYDALLKFLSL